MAVILLLFIFFFNSKELDSLPDKAVLKSSLKSANQVKETIDKNNSYAQGEIIIKIVPGTSDVTINTILGRLKLKTIKKISSRGVYLVKIEGNTTVDELVKSLKQIKEIEYSEPNYIRTTQHDQERNNE
jgi:predicted Fe-Mo cluster-binding NifX family protein